MLLEKTLESSLDCKKIQPVHPKWDQSWVFIGRTDVEAETPILLDTWFEALTHWKRPWCWERLRAGGEGDDRGWDGWMTSLTQWTWFGWTLGVGNEQGGLVCCSSWCRKELDTTEGLNWTELSRSTLALPVFFLGLASSFRLQKSSHSDGPLLYSFVLLIFLCLLCSLLSLIFSWDTVMGMSLKHLLLPLAESSQDLPSSFTDVITSSLWQCSPVFVPAFHPAEPSFLFSCENQDYPVTPPCLCCLFNTWPLYTFPSSQNT